MSVSPYLSGGLLGFIARRKVFVSYYHNADQAYRDYFERAFGHLFISN
jgi:hypothetical protein